MARPPEGWVDIDEARELPGLRLVLLRGVPSPWSLAARAIFELKGLRFAKAGRAPGDPGDGLRRWTGRSGCPVVAYESEPPRTSWAEILLLAERLAPTPRLIPRDAELRALAFGLSHELCGEMGLAWCRRLIGLAPRLRSHPGDPEVAHYARHYGSSPREVAAARSRVVEVLGLLAERLRAQRAAGSGFLVGPALSAVDVYWATFSNVISPLDSARMPLDTDVRRGFRVSDPEIRAALVPELIAHRDAIYARYLRLPVEV